MCTLLAVHAHCLHNGLIRCVKQVLHGSKILRKCLPVTPVHSGCCVQNMKHTALFYRLQQVEAVKREMVELDAMAARMSEEACDRAKQVLLMKLYRVTGPVKVNPAVEHISNLLAEGGVQHYTCFPGTAW